MSVKSVLFTLLLIVFALCHPSTARAGLFFNQLTSPFPPSEINFNKFTTHSQALCPSPPAPIQDLVFDSIYGDASSSIIDEEAENSYQKKISPLWAYETQIYRWIEKSFNNPSKSYQNITCSYQWLDYWAKENALLKGKTSTQGQAVRKWTLAAMSSQYIQIRNIKWIDKSTKKEIENWLSQLAKEVISDYSSNPEKTSRQNNHIYWAAWSVMITGVATDNRDFYNWAIKQYKKAIQSIETDGTLPLELARDSRAFQYHVFAMAPLVMISETATVNGYNLYNYKNGTLKKLADLIISESQNQQSYLSQKTGVVQNTEKALSSTYLAWLGPYKKRNDDSEIDFLIEKYSPLIQRRIGGNITRIYDLDQ